MFNQNFSEYRGGSLIRQVIKANAMLLVQYAVASLVPLLLVPHIVKVIGLEEYGHLAVLMAWGNYGSAIVQYAFQMTGPKRLANLAAGETPTSVFVDIVFAKVLLLSLVVPALALFAFISIPLESSGSFSWVLLFAMPIAVGFNSVWFLQAQGYFLRVCILAIIGSLLTLLIGFFCVNGRSNHAIDYAVVVTVFGSVFTGVGTLFLAISSIKSGRYEWRVIRAINALKDGWHLFMSQFVSMLYFASGPLVINHFLGAKAAGAYSVTERAINAFLSAALLTHTAAYPRLASAYVKNRPEYWRIIKFILLGYLSVTMAIAILAWLQRDRVAVFLYSEKNGRHDLLLLFGLVWLVLGIFGPALTGYLTVSGRSREVLPLNLKVLFSSVVLGILGVSMFDSAGWLGGLALSQLFLLITALREWGRKDSI